MTIVTTPLSSTSITNIFPPLEKEYLQFTWQRVAMGTDATMNACCLA